MDSLKVIYFITWTGLEIVFLTITQALYISRDIIIELHLLLQFLTSYNGSVCTKVYVYRVIAWMFSFVAPVLVLRL